LKRAQQAAAQADLSVATMTTRAKGKQRALTAEELQEKLNKLREEELSYNEIRQ